MKTVTITRISREEKTSKAGKPYESVGLQVKELGDKWINGFGGAWNKSWKEGDKVTLDLYKEEYNGKEYIKFRQVDINQILVMKLDGMKMKLDAVYEWVESQAKKDAKRIDTETRGYEYPENENQDVPFEDVNSELNDINPDDIPF